MQKFTIWRFRNLLWFQTLLSSYSFHDSSQGHTWETIVFYATKTDFFMQHSSENFTLSIIRERGTILILISCGNFNITRDRNTLLGIEILSPLNRRLQCERVRMRLKRDRKIIFESCQLYCAFELVWANQTELMQLVISLWYESFS